MTETDAKFEVVVVGAGPAGLAAACAAAEGGRRVALVDDTPWLGGQIWRGQSQPPQAREWIARFRRSQRLAKAYHLALMALAGRLTVARAA